MDELEEIMACPYQLIEKLLATYSSAIKRACEREWKGKWADSQAALKEVREDRVRLRFQLGATQESYEARLVSEREQFGLYLSRISRDRADDLKEHETAMLKALEEWERRIQDVQVELREERAKHAAQEALFMDTTVWQERVQHLEEQLAQEKARYAHLVDSSKQIDVNDNIWAQLFKETQAELEKEGQVSEGYRKQVAELDSHWSEELNKYTLCLTNVVNEKASLERCLVKETLRYEEELSTCGITERLLLLLRARGQIAPEPRAQLALGGIGSSSKTLQLPGVRPQDFVESLKWAKKMATKGRSSTPGTSSSGAHRGGQGTSSIPGSRSWLPVIELPDSDSDDYGEFSDSDSQE